jgi:CRP-like cAMP-binding protein
VKLADLKTQALRYLALGETEKALLVYRSIIRDLPGDLDARMKVADVLVHAGHRDLACRVYAAVAWCDLQAGRPLHALVCGQALADLGHPVASIHESLGALYGAGSPRLGGGHPPGRPVALAGPDPEADVPAIDLQPLPGSLAAESAAEMAADTATFALPPGGLVPIPLLSDLPAEVLRRIIEGALVRRLMPRGPIFQEGAAGYSFFLVASGAVEIYRGESPGRVVLGRRGEGEVFGELSVLAPVARAAAAEACEPCDLIEVPVRLLRAAIADDAQAQAAVARFTAERLLRRLLADGPLFQPLTVGQRLDLLRRFVLIEVPPETVVLRKGELGQGLHVVLQGTLEVFSGSEPFEEVRGRLRPGDVFGEIHLLRAEPMAVTVRSIDPSALLFLPGEAFEKVAYTVPSVREQLLHLPHETLRQLSDLGRGLLASPPQPDADRDEEALDEFPLCI